MGVGTTTLSSAAGPAKWAAVIALAGACGAGLTWSLTREPRAARAVPVALPAPMPEKTPSPTTAPAIIQTPPATLQPEATRPAPAHPLPAPSLPAPDQPAPLPATQPAPPPPQP